MERKGYSLVQVIVIIVITSIVSAFTVGIILSKNPSVGVGTAYGKEVDEFLNVYNKIVDGYYEDVDKEQLIQNAINGMMEYLDEQYTTYLDEDEASALMNGLNGKYQGIGITIKERTIINVLSSSPAEKAGLMPGDVIESVNEESVADKSGNEIVELIKKNTDKVSLGIIRDNQYYTFTMSLTTLNVPSVSYKMVDNTTIGYIQLSVFSAGTTREAEKAVSELKKWGAQKIIIDLRNNTGGYLDEAYNTASIFIEKGKIIYSLKNKDKLEKFKDETSSKEELPIAVLVNSGTASAAEVLASALKDSYGATIVGNTTYGKGKVQHTYSLEDGDLVKYTSSKWLRPNGVCIDGVGIKPDYFVENEIIYDDTDPENLIVIDIIDHQLSKAIELLS